MTLAELMAEVQRRRKMLPVLQKKAAQLEKELAVVRAEIEALGGTMPAATSVGRRQKVKAAGSARRSRPKNKVSLADAIVSVLSKSEAKPVKQIMREVVASGYKTTSRNFETIIYQTLARDNRIEKAGRGQYKLKE
ncbi:MAG: hypothetical protein NZ740_03890 [Kiritimatiellae bacterium]|nr:hypothetical protein [Kiritimatiellia bacterium]MDW8458231.1 hypothetical protein [Verrucomicrobiota bacterium]